MSTYIPCVPGTEWVQRREVTSEVKQGGSGKGFGFYHYDDDHWDV